jgi:hypothetical protein
MIETIAMLMLRSMFAGLAVAVIIMAAREDDRVSIAILMAMATATLVTLQYL